MTRLAMLSFLGAVAVLQPATAQESEQLLGRLEYERMRLYSGVERNLAVLLQNALRQKRAMPPGGGIMPMSLVDTRWRALGPDRVMYGGVATAGRVSAIAIHPTEMNILYAGGAQGGVWRSDDAGVNWRPLTDQECSLAMGSIAIDPVNPDIIYAGTGEQHFSGDSYYGCGVLRSLDAGETWEQQGARQYVNKSERSGGARIARVVIDRETAGSATSTTVLAASTFGLFRSTNSGASWNLVLDGTATDLVVHPTDPSIMYAALHGAGVYRSTNTGASWTHASAGMNLDIARRINLAIAPSEPQTLYASFQTGESKGDGLTMYRTVNGATSWQELSATGASCWYQCWYDMTIAVHPTNPQMIYFGSLQLYRSLNGGQTFSRHHNGIYVDEHLLVFDTLRGPNALYLANDGGVYRTVDGGTTWTSLATNLAVAQYYRGIGLHPSIAGITLGGTQDQGTQRSSTGTRVWEKVMGGDGGYTAFDVEDPSTWYGETQWIRGAGYSGPRKNGALVVRGIDTGERGLFIPPLVMDPVDSKRLYFGIRSLYRTDNSADSWERIYRTPSDREVISSIGLTPSDANTIYAGVLWGQVIVTRDGGVTWQQSGSGLPERFIGDVAVHPDDPDQAYAVAGGFLTGHVFHTVDGGRTWEDRTGNLPDHPVNAIVYDPADLEGVFIGTDLGVFHSARGGGTWERLDEDLPTVAVYDLAAHPGTSRLVAATHGRGMFEIPIDVPLSVRVRPGMVVDSVVTTDTVDGGEVIVAPSGKDDHAMSWQATSDAEWLVLTGGVGRGRGRFQYAFVGERMEEGDNEAFITVTGTGVDPVLIPVLAHYFLPSHLELGPAGPPVRVLVGSTEPVADSVAVLFSGPRPDTKWWATHAGGSWLELETATGAGPGAVTWTVNPTDLGVGHYVDTIFVEAEQATGSPAMFVDTFAVQPPLGIEETRESAGYGIDGWSLAPSDSLSSGLFGFGAEDLSWSAEASGAGWLVMERTGGGYGEAVVWRRNTEGLAVGVYEGTITVRVDRHPELVGVIVDRFEIVPPIAVDDAAHHFLGEDRLVPGQVLLLDWFGNRDGAFNAGDVLRWLDHCAAGGSGSGCAPDSGPDRGVAVGRPSGTAAARRGS
ncbi:MAG: hypothetical protein OXL34_11640 [Gemmatimonadota bacterium]|nr:hypothetical protein [Gemmatimonadota bacterium]